MPIYTFYESCAQPHRIIWQIDTPEDRHEQMASLSHVPLSSTREAQLRQEGQQIQAYAQQSKTPDDEACLRRIEAQIDPRMVVVMKYLAPALKNGVSQNSLRDVAELVKGPWDKLDANISHSQKVLSEQGMATTQEEVASTAVAAAYLMPQMLIAIVDHAEVSKAVIDAAKVDWHAMARELSGGKITEEVMQNVDSKAMPHIRQLAADLAANPNDITSVVNRYLGRFGIDPVEMQNITRAIMVKHE